MVEYASILWHIRQYKKPRLPMLLQMGLNFAASMIYLGITFRFRHGNSSVYYAWYVLAAVEVVLTFGLAAIFPVLSFTGTHLMKRMSTMTVLFLGDGVVIVAQNIVTIVKSPDSWGTSDSFLLDQACQIANGLQTPRLSASSQPPPQPSTSSSSSTSTG